jgi:hypothetical protein
MTAYSACPACRSTKIVGNHSISRKIYGRKGGNVGGNIGAIGGLGLGLLAAGTVVTGGLLAPLALIAASAVGASVVGENVGSTIAKSASVGTMGYFCEDCKNEWV